MTNCFIILPNQLFNKKYLKKYKKYDFYLLEDTLFFKDSERIKNYSKLKLVLHRASMKYYFDYLKDHNFKVKYIDFKTLNKKYYNF